MSFKRCKVVMLPASQKANLGDLFISSCMDNLFRVCNPDCKLPAQHLYITSDEEIKPNDWFIGMLDGVLTIQQNIPRGMFSPKLYPEDRKIIASTDIKLTFGWLRDDDPEKLSDHTHLVTMAGLPMPTPQFVDKFLKNYNEGKQIKEVMVEYEEVGRMKSGGTETFITELLKVNPKDRTITIRKVKDSWTKEEVITLLYKCSQDAPKESWIGFDKWVINNIYN